MFSGAPLWIIYWFVYLLLIKVGCYLRIENLVPNENSRISEFWTIKILTHSITRPMYCKKKSRDFVNSSKTQMLLPIIGFLLSAITEITENRSRETWTFLRTILKNLRTLSGILQLSQEFWTLLGIREFSRECQTVCGNSEHCRKSSNFPRNLQLPRFHVDRGR